jgi:HPt (histidine-containing phosphotransfer) domain-containing protein
MRGMAEVVGGSGAASAQDGCVPPPVDYLHLRKFTLGNKALEQEVLQLFAQQAPITLSQLQVAISEKAWRDAAHTMKGSAAAIGATTLARTAAEAELLRSDPACWPSAVSRVRLALDDVTSFITAELEVAA